MKNLIITKSQKDKLLQMARYHFREYVNIQWNTDDLGLTEYIAFWEKDSLYSKDIHWYEFLITKIVPLLFSKDYNTFQVGELILTESDHPVDYIYASFINE